MGRLPVHGGDRATYSLGTQAGQVADGGDHVRLGDALMAAMGGDDDPYESTREATEALVRHYGSVSAAARGLDVPRRTLRGWLAGRQPRGGGGWLADVAREFRRAERAADAGPRAGRSLPSVGSGPPMRGAEDRTISLGQWLQPGTVDRVRDLYLGGADAEDLARAFHDGITDGGFYASTFDPDSDEGFWDLDWIDFDDDVEVHGTFYYE